MKYIELNSYRKKGINAYLVKEGEPHTKNMYGEPVTENDKQAAFRNKKHKVKVRIDNLENGKYIYKEAGGAELNKARYGWVIITNGEITEES